ncbi:FaeA family protein [Gemmatirosa kalamazoonensis]|jgi:DeoR family suf operon transcriptional repressor|uniref:FaeA family protein n=1 Tax=Gemmatirosa kalamazoonensis TaxID=861299 RepID=W0RM04_9BACT|nr:FaeA/PapI family transcriptional regulator [Gemmatirosa kalamazoonensis]AHG91776.1 FaeA family protein [Gemmatirosa kalamazoonensis]
MSLRLRHQFLESPRGRIATLLRRSALTVDEIASALALSHNAVRVQLMAMERDGLVRRQGTRRGPTRPSAVYELTPELDQLLSRAYVPLLTHLVSALAERTTPEEFDRVMREAGRGFGRELVALVPDAPLDERVAAASRVLNAELGALTDVEHGAASLRIQGRGCPLAALTGKHPGVCHAIESVLVELLGDGAAVHECCDRSARPRCCFEIRASA